MPEGQSNCLFCDFIEIDSAIALALKSINESTGSEA